MYGIVLFFDKIELQYVKKNQNCCNNFTISSRTSALDKRNFRANILICIPLCDNKNEVIYDNTFT